MKWTWVFLILIGSLTANGQVAEYYMSNGFSSDCIGILRDSEEGDKAGNYDHNEDYIFKICVPGAKEIKLKFDSFCTEAYEDYLIIYDGSDTTATKFGKYSGSTSPGTFTSSGNCVTFYFHSDKSVSCFGWKMLWDTKIEPPKAPRFLNPPDVSCKDGVIGVRFNQKLNCDSIRDTCFVVSGVLNPVVSSLKPVNCDGNNETDSFLLTLDRVLDKSGSYRVDFTYIYYDACDSGWVLDTFVNFVIDDCPIEVELFLTDDTICKGSCTDLWAEITGGDSTKYRFTWNPNLPGNAGPHTVCPTTTTTYSLYVEDGAAVPDSDTITLYVVDPPVAMNDTSVCRTGGQFRLSATPPGGVWSGKGVMSSDNWMYDPQQAGAGLDTVLYTFGGCSDMVIINVRNIWAGYDDAACPGSSPYKLSVYVPAGGFWTGPNIDSAGNFDPSDTGVYTVTYNWNGCTDKRDIYVYPISVPEYDTFCLSDPIQTLGFTPKGGRWSGKGIVNSVLGQFNPAIAGGGDHLLQYIANGCRDTMYVFVIDIDARYNEVTCPDEGPITVVPAIPSGGYWTGVGITDSLKGEYDASFVHGLNRTWYNDTLSYHLKGCVDKKIMYVRRTEVRIDSLWFCIGDTALLLNWYSVQSTPGGGKWTGDGIKGYYFDPSAAGYGSHTIKYKANGCEDSTVLTVYPETFIQSDTDFCVTDPPFDLYTGQSGGLWSGRGITDAVQGTFEPQKAGVGVHILYYTSEHGCLDSTEVTVYGRPVISINPLDPSYCLKDSLFALTGNPRGGAWSGTGVVDSSFNPRLAGSGPHTIYYTYGRPTCNSTDSAVANVGDTLKLLVKADNDTICEGGDVILTASGNGGKAGQYRFWWNTGETGTTVIKSPVVTTPYIVRLEDGCSDPAIDTFNVIVNPKVKAEIMTSTIQCYGEMGFAELTPTSDGTHTIEWRTVPVKYGNRLNALVTNRYYVTVFNNETGCRLDTFADIPGYEKIRAAFRTSPSTNFCLDPFDPSLYVINQSSGGITGHWEFGDGTIVPFDPLINPLHVYKPDTNRYTVKLYIENEGGCPDSTEVIICVNDSVYLYIPTAFSPGDDGLNDVFRIYAANVTDFEVQIYNRWGERIYESRDKDFTWDGTYKGEKLMTGMYKYIIKYKGKITPWKVEHGVLFIKR